MGDRLEDRFDLIEHLFVLEAQDREALRAKVGVTLMVGLLAFRGRVNITVAFDDQLRVVTEEIGDVVAKLVLPPKLCPTQLAIAKKLPKKLLCRSLPSTQLASYLRQSGKLKSSPSFTPSPTGRGLG